jgi:hypothetical protein
MRSLIAAVAIAVVALVAASPRAAADSTAKGTVASVGADSLTVKVDGKDMTFKVTEKTAVIARGATTATKLAHQKGETGPKLADVVHASDEVELKYAEAAGVMTATEVRVTKKAAK